MAGQLRVLPVGPRPESAKVPAPDCPSTATQVRPARVTGPTKPTKIPPQLSVPTPSAWRRSTALPVPLTLPGDPVAQVAPGAPGPNARVSVMALSVVIAPTPVAAAGAGLAAAAAVSATGRASSRR